MKLRKIDKQLILLSLGIFLSLAHGVAQTPDRASFRALPGFPFVLISDEFTENPPEISDSLFDAAACGIRFQVNRTELQPTDPFIGTWNQLIPWLKSQEMQLGQVYIKGASSPEGPYQNNVRLSRGRTQRLVEFICEGLGQKIEELPINASSVTEDYGLLVKMLQQAGDPDYQKVNAIWEQSGGDEQTCKRQLMALEKGKVWRRLVKEYFPALRQARVILWFTRRPEAKVVHPVKAGDVPLPYLSYYPTTLASPNYRITWPTRDSILTRRHLIAARTNLAHDFFFFPGKFGFAPGVNLQLEYYPLKGHYTANVGFTFTNHRHWNDYKFFQVRNLELEVRRYFKGQGLFRGPYLGLYANGVVYGIGFGKTEGWEGEGGGGGLSAGWVWNLNRKGNLRLEVSLNVGVLYTRYDPYVYGNPITGAEDGLYYYDYHGNTSDFRKRNHQFFWFGPTNAGIHLTYDIIYRKWKPVGSYNEPYQTKKVGR